MRSSLWYLILLRSAVVEGFITLSLQSSKTAPLAEQPLVSSSERFAASLRKANHGTAPLGASPSSSNSDAHHNEDDATAMSDIRKARLEKESSTSKWFALGEELKSLREDLENLRHNLEWAKALKDDVRIQSLEKAIQNGQNRDPHLMYRKAFRLLAEARKMKDESQEEKDALIGKWSSVASAAREVLPEFAMQGLWVGNYGGSHGTQMINITYSGDEIIALKCTGDLNVPRGEVTFTVNLEPCDVSASPTIPPIGEFRKGEFRTFPGKGQVSRRGFKDLRYVEGQMILFENQFRFAWIPTQHNVLFHRPNLEMTLKLLRNTISNEDELENMRDHVSRCFQMDLSTAIASQQHNVNEPLRRIATLEDLEEAERLMKESKRCNIFYRMSIMREYMDQVLDNKKQ